MSTTACRVSTSCKWSSFSPTLDRRHWLGSGPKRGFILAASSVWLKGAFIWALRRGGFYRASQAVAVKITYYCY
ncbi:hypothetical protein cu1124 [Corynebacterium urealyticum DSM 7109]|uniref:Uncharacterized protein n=1 Tax=Corynebacterium urealyticum (strain ATCC 43042 / DSM 7109) TaxID=504474 RepID=B1VH43_CORU7|nr:hypothetical protein cu1124 [Corynebacterium urealyticum DSM 7109]